jgi:hypothetical protein
MISSLVHDYQLLLLIKMILRCRKRFCSLIFKIWLQWLRKALQHYVQNSPLEPENTFSKVDSENLADIDADLIEKGQEQVDNSGQECEEQETQYEKSVEGRRRKKKMLISG